MRCSLSCRTSNYHGRRTILSTIVVCTSLSTLKTSNERIVVVLKVVERWVLNIRLMSRRLFRTCLRPKISNETTKILIEKMCAFVRKGATSSTNNFLPLQHQVINNPIKSTTTIEQQESVYCTRQRVQCYIARNYIHCVCILGWQCVIGCSQNNFRRSYDQNGSDYSAQLDYRSIENC